MKRLLLPILAGLLILAQPSYSLAAGITASGGTKKAVGQTFTVTVTASGATFDSLQGNLAISGPVSVVSISAGSATWLPGKEPANGKQFVGLTSATSSLTVARVTLKGTKEGSGSVSVSGVKLAYKGAVVGSDGGSTSFTITRALTPPGGPKVSSSTHPDPNTSYEATTVKLEWPKDPGVTGFSYVFDQAAETTPSTTVTTAETSATFEGKPVGVHYFHLRAQNGDGWGNTTHFKITIKEPDAKIDETLAKPEITKIELDSSFDTNIEEGTVSGIAIAGKGIAGYTMNLVLSPTPTLPEGKSLTVEVNEQGTWSYLIDYPIRAGFYKLSAQGQKEKTLTPVSETQRFELTLAKGGGITKITSADTRSKNPSPSPKSLSNAERRILGVTLSNTSIFGILLLGVILFGGIGLFIRHRRK